MQIVGPHAHPCHRPGDVVAKPRRLFIADPGLTGALGHHFGYSAAVALAARAEGIAPLVLASRSFAGEFAEDAVPVRPVFGARYQSAGSGGRLRRLLYVALAELPEGVSRRGTEALRGARRWLYRARSDSFGAELAEALAAEAAGAEDVVLLHSVSAANLAGLSKALAPRLLVILRRTPSEMDRDDAAPEPVLRLLARLYAAPGLRLSLFADTEDLAKIFGRGTGLPVAAVPLPVVVPLQTRPTPGTIPHVVFAGGARVEKGYAMLPEAITAVAGRARFTIHSGPVDAASDPLVQRAHRRLRSMQGAGVTLLESALALEAYAALLASADLLLLPYDRAAYGPRSSGILAEALALGTPAVVPADCWMAEAAGPERAIIIPPEGDLKVALGEALDRLPSLGAAARAASGAWRARHNPQALLRALLSLPAPAAS